MFEMRVPECSGVRCIIILRLHGSLIGESCDLREFNSFQVILTSATNEYHPHDVLLIKASHFIGLYIMSYKYGDDCQLLH